MTHLTREAWLAGAIDEYQIVCETPVGKSNYGAPTSLENCRKIVERDFVSSSSTPFKIAGEDTWTHEVGNHTYTVKIVKVGKRR